ncbi:uncharacterized protein CEXT_373781 [Caerostris extrusa]|uniref:Uncharacterized protein n=1 Tax=Caerostris extrusa TaxID=172846 RepID=A0AAV4WTW8_CAEEX|nr:uncharacterized protein CEXT_373781 [Caerostris extrusa]
MLTEADFKFIPLSLFVFLVFWFSPTTVTEDPVSLTSRTVSKFRNSSSMLRTTIRKGNQETKNRKKKKRKLQQQPSSRLDHQNWDLGDHQKGTAAAEKEGNGGAGFPIGTFAREKGTGQLSLVRTNRQVPLSILFTWQVIEPGRTSAVRTCPAPYLQVKSRRDCTMTKKPVAFHQSCWTAQFFPTSFPIWKEYR